MTLKLPINWIQSLLSWEIIANSWFSVAYINDTEKILIYRSNQLNETKLTIIEIIFSDKFIIIIEIAKIIIIEMNAFLLVQYNFDISDPMKSLFILYNDVKIKYLHKLYKLKSRKDRSWKNATRRYFNSAVPQL